MSGEIVFDFFRYQILPISQQIQLNLFKSYDDSIQNKNIYFATALINSIYRSAGKDLVKDIKEVEKDFYILKLGKKINIKRYTENLSPEKIDSFPPTTIFIDNNPKFQTISIEQNNVFRDTDSVIRILLRTINEILKDKSLTVKIAPIFNPKSFWQFVGENKKSIRYVDFMLITPNMSNISSTLSEDLRKAAQSTKAIKTNVKLQSEAGATLEIEEDNSQINDLVDYASKGGGRVFIKGLKSKYDSRRQQKTFSIESMDGNHQDIIAIIRALANEQDS